MGFDLMSACYAISVAAGGVVGYVKAGSTSSLLAGLAFGGLLGFGAYQTSFDERNYVFSFATTCVLGTIMGVRYYNSGKFMPAGLIATISVVMAMRFVAKHFIGSKALSR